MPKGDNPNSQANLLKGRVLHPNNKGPSNLAAWNAEHGHGSQNITHGKASKTIRKRYEDPTTSEGARLQKIMADIVESLGGPSEISVEQNIILGNLRSKLIVTLEINLYISKRKSLISKGEILPVLKAGQFPTYTTSIEKALVNLRELKRIKGAQSVPNIGEIINNG